MSQSERLKMTIEYIAASRFFTLQNLMDEFGISKSTAQRDVLTLTAGPYYIPIDSVLGQHGGYHVADGWKPDKEYLSPKQAELLHRLLDTADLNAEDTETMMSIFRAFEMPAM